MATTITRNIVASGVSCAVTFVLDVVPAIINELAADSLAIKRNVEWGKMSDEQMRAFGGHQTVKASYLLARKKTVVVRPMTDAEVMAAFMGQINKLRNEDRTDVFTMLEDGEEIPKIDAFIKETLASYEVETDDENEEND